MTKNTTTVKDGPVEAATFGPYTVTIKYKSMASATVSWIKTFQLRAQSNDEAILLAGMQLSRRITYLNPFIVEITVVASEGAKEAVAT